VSSSALANPGIASITFSVLHESALSGQGDHIGVATSYLSSLEEGDALQVAIRPSPEAFALPSDQERTPLLCIAAGTGLAPFRGFIQERAIMIATGRKLAPAILFFGCRSPDVDDLYKDEFAEWQRIGAVDVRHAYSVQSDASEGCKHVQDRLWHDRYDLVNLWRDGAKVFMCGSSGVAESVREMVVKIKKETDPDEPSEEEARAWFQSLRNIRYVTDVFD
jgi:cytochrome P450/NADPH-cytochrome P450 reductase